jgi:hypothetical protein
MQCITVSRFVFSPWPVLSMNSCTKWHTELSHNPVAQSSGAAQPNSLALFIHVDVPKRAHSAAVGADRVGIR